MEPYKHETVNLRFEKVIGTWTEIFQSNLFVFLTPYISPSLIINNVNPKNILFKEDNRIIPLARINTKRLFLKLEF